MHLKDGQLFDIKTLLLIREEVRLKLQDELQLPFLTWTTDYLETLRDTLAKKTGILLSERAMRQNIKDKVTDSTTIPHVKTNASRVDLLCRYLGYPGGLREYQQTKAAEIKKLTLKTEATYTLGKQTAYDTTQVQQKDFYIAYYCNYQQDVSSGILTLDHTTHTLTFDLKFPASYAKDTEFIRYTGTFNLTQENYLLIQGKAHIFQQETYIQIIVYLDDYRKKYKFFTATFNTNSMQDNAALVGLSILEKCTSYEEARGKIYQVDHRVVDILKGKRITTERRCYYNLNEMANYHHGKRVFEK